MPQTSGSRAIYSDRAKALSALLPEGWSNREILIALGKCAAAQMLLIAEAGGSPVEEIFRWWSGSIENILAEHGK